MDNLNKANWQCFVIHITIAKPDEVVVKPLPDFECIQIGMALSSTKKNPQTHKKLFCPSIGLAMNVYSCIAISKNGEFKVVKKAVNNERDERRRPEETEKDAPLILNTSIIETTNTTKK